MSYIVMCVCVCVILGEFHRYVMKNDRSIGRSRLIEQRRDRWRADRSAWRHRAEARRVKAGWSVSRLSDAIMPLATIVRNANVAPRHTSFRLLWPRLSHVRSVTRERRPHVRKEWKGRWLFREKRRNVGTLNAVRLLPEPSSFHGEPSMAWRQYEALCNEVKRSKMVTLRSRWCS